MNHKGQASLLFNVIIGLVFIFLTFAMFMIANSKIEDLKEGSIQDIQHTDYVQSYVAILSQLDKNDVKEFTETRLILQKEYDEKFFSESNSAETFQGSVLKATTDNTLSTFCVNREGSDGIVGLKTSFIYFLNDEDVESFSVCSLFISENREGSRWFKRYIDE